MLDRIENYDSDSLGLAVQRQENIVQKFFGAKLEWSPYWPAIRSAGQQISHQRIASSWPRFAIRGNYQEPPDGKAFLWRVVQSKLGKHFLTYYQESGSCVGNGFGQSMNYLQAIDSWQRGQAEEVLVPYFWLYPYGISRWIMDPNAGPGEGSFGTAIAEAATRYGLFAQSSLNTLPQPNEKGGFGLTWGEKNEIAWSHINPTAKKWEVYTSLAQSHPVTTSALLTSADEVAESIINGYPVTCASNWGGLMKCPVVGTGENAYLQNRRAATSSRRRVILHTE